MHEKNIKTIIRKQLKKEYPNWKRLTKKEKRNIAAMVLNEVVKGYDFNQQIDTPEYELLGIEEQKPNSKIMNLEKMAQFIDNHYDSMLFRLKNKTRHSYIKDEELKIIDELLDDDIINKLLSYDGYTPAMRDFFPGTFLRAELLKVIKYPEISYRKFCGDDKRYKGYKENNEYTGTAQKQNRSFIGLSLRKKQMLSHIQLSQFRSGLSFSQLVNLTVYILHQFNQCGFLDDGVIHCVDSTELAVECQQLLATLKIGDKKIRIYDDIDCDCGKRRKKRDKSVYVVGYRLHTLTAINPETGRSFPLISLLSPANHNDSNFLLPLINLGKAMGLDVKLVTADEAYNDGDGALQDETGTHLIRPPSSKVIFPENVDTKTLQVTYDDLCEIPMDYAGTEDQHHEFRCSAEPGECFRLEACPQFRQIPFDNGHFQRIIHGSDEVAKALDIRKNGERPFNLLKKREGLEEVRVRSQHGLLARCTITTMATLLIEIAGTRRKPKQKPKQEQIEFDMAA
ncbi:MAG: transposase [Desulfobacterales bacterium]|nr:transposase [Desulfobacterales bacterium]